MSVLTRLAVNHLNKRGLLADPNSWLTRHFGGKAVVSGVQVNEETAMQSTAVFASVRLIAGTIASLPLPVYQRRGNAKERDSDSPIYKLIHDRPNSELSSFQWRQTGIAHQLLYGNWYNEVEYKNGKPWAIWPIPPWRVKIITTKRGKFYEVSIPDGESVILPSSKVLHIPNITVKGSIGVSCIQAGAEAIGLAIAAEQYGASFFGQGTNVGMVVEHPGKIAPDRRESFAEQLRVSYAGLKKAHKLMLLEEGMKVSRIGIPPNEAQFIETRKYQVAEIGRLFGITQLHKIGDLERATFSNVEHLGIEFVTDTIRPLLVNIEQEFNYKLFEDDSDSFAEFLVDGLLRGDTATRYAAYATARQWGWMSANDIRSLENMNPLPDEQGDIYLIPMNMIPAGQVDDWEPKTTGEPEPAERNIEIRSIEQRSKQALFRAQVAKRHERIFKELAQKIVTREKQHIAKALNKHLTERGLISFDEWLEDFYREFRPFVANTMRPAIMTLAEAVRDIAAQEVSAEGVEITPDVNAFVERQADAHVIRSRSTVKSLITKAEQENLNAVELVESRLDEWEEKRADQIANDSTVAISNIIAKVVFAAAGFQRLMWVAAGGNSCPYCTELSGKIIGIDQPFLSKDSTLESEDGRMPINKPTFAPPLHKGCECGLTYA